MFLLDRGIDLDTPSAGFLDQLWSCAWMCAQIAGVRSGSHHPDDDRDLRKYVNPFA